METSLDPAVSSVAVLIDDPARFEARAAEVARQLGPEVIEELSRRFHTPPQPEPDGFGPRERGLGGWLQAWQFAVFELFFQFREAALPVLRRVAFGDYDWTQGNAVEVLCRLAAAGIERGRVIAQLRQEFPKFRYEATLYSVGPVLYHATRDPAVAAVVRELDDLPEWRAATEELQRAGRA